MKVAHYLVAVGLVVQTYAVVAQTSPMKIIVPFAAGGGGDLLARMLAPKLSEELKRPVMVENKVGASGQLGMQFVKTSAPDGSVVVLASDQATVVVPLTYANANYDTAKDFVGLGRVAQFPYALALSKGLRVETVDEFLSYLRKNPSSASVGTPSVGGIPEMAATALAKKSGVEVTTIPYSGAAPIIAPLMGGQVTSAVIGFNNVFPLHKEGKLKVLAVTGATRTKLGPAIPTFEESGLPGLKLVSTWTFYAPRGFSSAEATRFNAALNKVLGQKEIVQKIEGIYMDVAPTTLAETKAELEEAIEEWTEILKQQGSLKR